MPIVNVVGNSTNAGDFKPFEARMRAEGLDELVIATFRRHYEKLLNNTSAEIPCNTIREPEQLPELKQLGDDIAEGRQALKHTVLMKLNGGLGTSMGLQSAKSLLHVKEGLSFLDIIIRQALHVRREYRCDLPVVFMNSYRTKDDTEACLRRYDELVEGQASIPPGFLQHRIPKINAETLAPVEHPGNSNLEWCPPGHGDFYTALVSSNVLEHLLRQGIKYAFVSNADNLGATLDLRLLGYFAANDLPFMMEVTRRTAADRKGGHLAQAEDGRLILRERAQCPKDEMEDFQDISRHRYFNTNNLWINLEHLADELETHENYLDLPLIMNRKTVDPRDPDSTSVYQLETAMGSAISVFPKASAIVVPRTRFVPVKTTNDLLALRSDLFILADDMTVQQNEVRDQGSIVIDLDPHFYKLVDDFEHRFREGIPSLLQCTKLVVRGDFEFSRGVSLAGDIYLKNRTHHEVAIPPGTTLRQLSQEERL